MATCNREMYFICSQSVLSFFFLNKSRESGISFKDSAVGGSSVSRFSIEAE